jgi:hypothetical protein
MHFPILIPTSLVRSWESNEFMVVLKELCMSMYMLIGNLVHVSHINFFNDHVVHIDSIQLHFESSNVHSNSLLSIQM